MAKKLGPRETVDFKELLVSEIVQSEALVNLLDRKAIISRQELLEEINRIGAKLPKAES